MDRQEMFNIYNEHAGAHEYILGFADKESVYMVERSADELIEMLKTDRAGSKRGGYQTLRFRPTTAQKTGLIETAVRLCSLADFIHRIESCKYNRGEVFEAIVTEFFGQVWTKDNVPFTEAGDINVNGVEIQIKFDQATFVTEPQLTRFLTA